MLTKFKIQTAEEQQSINTLDYLLETSIQPRLLNWAENFKSGTLSKDLYLTQLKGEIGLFLHLSKGLSQEFSLTILDPTNNKFVEIKVLKGQIK